MVAARTVLIAALLAGLVLVAAVASGGAATGRAAPAGASPPVACLDCHQPHYAQAGSCVDCHRGDARATRAELAHHRLLSGATAAWSLAGSPVPARAAALRDSLGCRRCHLSGGRGEKLAIDLDAVIWQRTQDELRQALREPATAMPDFGLGTATADTLAAILLREGNRYGGSPRYQVRFRAGSDDSLRVFAHLCGGCHRALTPAGPQGTGNAGPDLSALLGAFHPAAADSAWSRERLERWLRNPRAARPQATMLPVDVKPAEMDALLEALAPPPPPPAPVAPTAPAGVSTR